jgi:hypothetical protein
MPFLLSAIVAALSAAVIATFPPALAPASAQTPTAAASQPDLVAVMLWTLAVVTIAMLVLTLGYLYRRVRGAQDEVILQNVDPYFQAAGHAEAHDTGELHAELPAVPEHLHDPASAEAAHGSAH